MPGVMPPVSDLADSDASGSRPDMRRLDVVVCFLVNSDFSMMARVIAKGLPKISA